MINEHYHVERGENESVAMGSELTVTVTGPGHKVFHRNGIKKPLGEGETIHVRWLVCMINGVYVYVNGNNIIVTTDNLRP